MSEPTGPGVHAVPARPLLPGFFQVIAMGSDVAQLRSAGRVVRLAAPGMGELASRVLPELDGTASIEDVATRLQLDVADVAGLVSSLHRQGIIEDAASASPADGAAAEAFAELGRPRADVRAALAAARAAVVGEGPLSRLIGGHLSEAGLGGLVLAASLDEVLGQGPGGPLGAAMDSIDLVVMEADESAERAAVANDALLVAGVRALWHMTTTVEAVVGPTVEAGGRPCRQCLALRRAGHLRYYEEWRAWQEVLDDDRIEHRVPNLLSGWASMVGGLISIEVLRILGGADPRTRGGVLVADLRTLEVRREALLAIPGCPACSARQEEIVVAR